MKKLNSILFHRSGLVGVSLLVQIAVLAAVIVVFSIDTAYFYWGCVLLSFLALLWIIGCRMEPAYKIAWLIPILLMPVFGGIFYLLSGGSGVSNRTRRKLRDIEQLIPCLIEGEALGYDFCLGRAEYQNLYAKTGKTGEAHLTEFADLVVVHVGARQTNVTGHKTVGAVSKTGVRVGNGDSLFKFLVGHGGKLHVAHFNIVRSCRNGGFHVFHTGANSNLHFEFSFSVCFSFPHEYRGAR